MNFEAAGFSYMVCSDNATVKVPSYLATALMMTTKNYINSLPYPSKILYEFIDDYRNDRRVISIDSAKAYKKYKVLPSFYKKLAGTVEYEYIKEDHDALLKAQEHINPAELYEAMEKYNRDTFNNNAFTFPAEESKTYSIYTLAKFRSVVYRNIAFKFLNNSGKITVFSNGNTTELMRVATAIFRDGYVTFSGYVDYAIKNPVDKNTYMESYYTCKYNDTYVLLPNFIINYIYVREFVTHDIFVLTKLEEFLFNPLYQKHCIDIRTEEDVIELARFNALLRDPLAVCYLNFTVTNVLVVLRWFSKHCVMYYAKYLIHPSTVVNMNCVLKYPSILRYTNRIHVYYGVRIPIRKLIGTVIVNHRNISIQGNDESVTIIDVNRSVYPKKYKHITFHDQNNYSVTE